MEDNKKKFDWKPIYIIVLVVITATVCSIFGSFRYAKHIKGCYIGSIGHENSSAEADTTFDIGAFEVIDADVNACTIEIITGDKFAAFYKGTDSLEPKVTLDGKTLKIRQKVNVHNFTNKSAHITITVPAGTVITRADIKADAGNIEIKEVNFKTVTMDLDAGNVSIRKIVADSLQIDADAGNIEVYESELSTVKMDADAGRIYVQKSTLGNTTATASMGSIELVSTDFATGNFESSMGSIDIRGNFDSIRAKCSMGSIEINSDSIDGKPMNLETSMGSIRINGVKYKNSYNQ